MIRISLWLYGVCAIRTPPTHPGQWVEERVASWRAVYGDRADIRYEDER